MADVIDIQHNSSSGVGSKFQAFCSAALSATLEYDTPKIVHIKSKKVGLINRILQLAIIGYIIGWVLVYKKGYQSTDDVVSAVTCKLKGVAYTNITDDPNLNVKDTSPYNRIWDVSDYVIPPQQTNAFFVMTNMIITPDQQKGECPEDPDIPNAVCSDDSDCPAGEPMVNGNGVRTGKCVNYTYPDGDVTTTCQIKAWCPTEFDEIPVNNTAILMAAVNFTVLIKNSIQFPKFNASKRNILESSNSTYLKNCHYDKKDHPFCPVFPLGTIANDIGADFNSLAYKGAVVGILIRWDCNLDYSLDNCRPVYTFKRLDNKNALIAPGYNFRFSNNYKEGGVEYRTLTKAYGILFQVIVTGEAGKFDVVPLILNIASGLALLSLASIMCDICVLYFLQKRYFYRKKKYQMVDDNPYEDMSDAGE
ncbi:P2X purinoceptor 4-like [Diadema antillarum]|uniref:P2X purinoceptor 4-like n=1 Tax=Diadema antillarum TaxID=105358 RepID=UPI003A858912